MERYLFFNSTANDRRKHQAQDMADYWDSFLSTGIINEDTDIGLEVTTTGQDLNIDISPGRALMKGHLYVLTESLQKTLRLAPAGSSRIDRIVLRLDLSIDSRFIKVFVKEGTAAVNPQPPELTREGDIYELSLATITVVGGESTINLQNIVDDRLNESLCGLASSLVKVPTDVYTAQFEAFRVEYNRWFEEIQSSTFATVKDVRRVDNDIKREIANLNLQLEASRRVPQGKTFGTNFDTSFDMNIDYTKTSSNNSLNIGENEVEVLDASGFIVGTEITIYDDENLQRVKIQNINGNTIVLNEPTSFNFKEGVNIARTMSLSNAVNKELNFGSWGSYKFLSYNLSGISLPGFDNPTPRNSMVFVKDAFFTLVRTSTAANLNLYKMGVNENTFTDTGIVFSYNTNNSQRTSAPDLLVINDFLVVVQNNKIDVYDSEVNLLSTFDLQASYDNKIICLDKRNNRILYFVGGSTLSLAEFTVDLEGNLNRLSDFSVLINSATNIFWYTSGLSPFIVHSNGEISIIIPKSTYTNNSPSATEARLIVIDENKNVISNNLLFPISVSGFFGSGVGYEYNNKYYYYFYTSGGDLSIVETTDFSNFTRTQLSDDPIRINAVFDANFGINANNNVFIRNFDKNNVVRFDVDSKTFEVVYSVASSPNFKRTDSLYVDKDSTDNNSWFLLSNSVSPNNGTNHLFIGEGYLGYGSPLTINDVRFKISDTTECAMWISHDRNLEVTEAKFGNLPMEKETITGETQFTAVSPFDMLNEVRFTFTRPILEANVKINKILGGIN